MELKHFEYSYPPDEVLSLSDKTVSFGETEISVTFTRLCLVIILSLTVLELALFGVPESPAPYSYDFFVGVLLAALILVYLRKSHKYLSRSADEFVGIVRENRDDPLIEDIDALDSDMSPEEVKKELRSLLHKGFHPVGMIVGGFVVFLLEVVLLWWFGSPELGQPVIARFMGFVNGMILSPVLFFFLYFTDVRKYVIDVRFFDPEGVGGLQRTGTAIVSIATYLIIHITILSASVSALYFAGQTEFLTTVSAILSIWVLVIIGGTVLLTVMIRKRLIDIRNRIAMEMEEKFRDIEHRFWSEETDPDQEVGDSIAILAMQSQYREMSRMNMWPIDLVNLAKLTGSVLVSAVSVIVYMYQLT